MTHHAARAAMLLVKNDNGMLPTRAGQLASAQHFILFTNVYEDFW